MSFLKDKVAVVTGGNRGIGRGVVEALNREGATVVLTARKLESAERAAREVGERTHGFACDVRDQAAVETLFAEVAQRFGGCDVLVNNAGIGIFAPLVDLKPEDWRAVIETNVNGIYYCCRSAIPQMKQRGGGYIFNVSSLAGKNAFPNGTAYNASKFAVNGLSEALMQEVRYDNIRVSYLMPGSVATEFGRGSTAKEGWALTAADVAEVVIDLLRSPARALYSRVEMRPSRPPRRAG